MIISASRRTDIPAFFSEKFYNDLAKGFTYSKNPCTQFCRYNGNISILDLSSITEYYNFNNLDAQKLYICHNLFDFTF